MSWRFGKIIWANQIIKTHNYLRSADRFVLSVEENPDASEKNEKNLKMLRVISTTALGGNFEVIILRILRRNLSKVSITSFFFEMDCWAIIASGRGEILMEDSSK